MNNEEDIVEIRVKIPSWYKELKGERTWREVIERGLNLMGAEEYVSVDEDGNTIIDQEFAEWLVEIERDFKRYFKGMCSIGYGTFTTKYKRDYGRKWLSNRAGDLKLSPEVRERILSRLEELAIEELKAATTVKPLDISEEKLKVMRESDYIQFKLLLQYLASAGQYDFHVVFDWIRNRARKYGAHLPSIEMLKDFVSRYREECRKEGKVCDIPQSIVEKVAELEMSSSHH